MNKHRIWIIPSIIILSFVVAILGFRLYQQLTSSFEAQVLQGPVNEEVSDLTPPSIANELLVAARLREAGLNEAPSLGDTAVSGHLARLENGEVSEETLLQYADDLVYLNEYTAANGGAIPTNFWDVRTSEMTENGWDEYWIVRQIAIQESEPYLLLLTQGYGRFLQFKEAEESGEDTALDAALDIFAHVEDYWTAVTPDAEVPESPEEMKGIADAKLLVWQSLVAGSTRINPITNEPMFSHSIFARNNVGTMYQYDQGEAMGIAEVWGVTGFAPRFVGTPENNNQVEHMSISSILQMVMEESVVVLDVIEEEKVIAGGADPAEANADMALNNAIHSEFAPFYAEDGLAAVEHLRCVLKSEIHTLDC